MATSGVVPARPSEYLRACHTIARYKSSNDHRLKACGLNGLRSVQLLHSSTDQPIREPRKKLVDQQHPAGVAADYFFRDVAAQPGEDGGGDFFGSHAPGEV